MTIKQQGGIFGRNPTFNDLTVEGTLSGISNLSLTGNLSFDNGQGIDFSATSGTGTSELFDDYEEGTWTPTQGTFSTWTSPTFDATYTKVGRLVQVNLRQTGGTINSGGTNYMGGLPYTPRQASSGSTTSGALNITGVTLAWTDGNFYFSINTGNQTSLVATVVYEV